MTSTRDDDQETITPSKDQLEVAAEAGPLPVTPTRDDAKYQTKDVPPEDAEEKAEDAAAGDVVGGINMR